MSVHHVRVLVNWKMAGLAFCKCRNILFIVLKSLQSHSVQRENVMDLGRNNDFLSHYDMLFFFPFNQHACLYPTFI